MPNELTTNVNMGTMLSVFKDKGKVSKLNEESQGDVNVNDLIPAISLSRENEVFSVEIGGEPLPTFNATKALFLAFVRALGSKTLWAPKAHEDDFQRPLCGTGWVTTGESKNATCKGRFTFNEHIGPPYEEPEWTDADGNWCGPANGDSHDFDCARCPYNKFGSKSSYDASQEGSNAKACSEARTYFVLPVKRGPRLDFDNEDLYVFTPDTSWKTTINKHGLGKLGVSYGSNKKPVEHIATAPAIREIPLSAMVFRVKVKHETSGQYTIAKMEPEVQGFLHPEYWETELSDDDGPVQGWLSDFIGRNKRAAGVDSTESSEKTEATPNAGPVDTSGFDWTTGDEGQ